MCECMREGQSELEGLIESSAEPLASSKKHLLLLHMHSLIKLVGVTLTEENTETSRQPHLRIMASLCPSEYESNQTG